MAISSSRAPTWTDDGSAIVIAIQPMKKKEDKAPAKKEAEKIEDPQIKGEKKGGKKGGKGGAPVTGGGNEKPDLVIWHWQDERLQSQQQVQASQDKGNNYLCVYRPFEKKFMRLADEKLKQVTIAPRGRYAIGIDTKPYQLMGNLDGKKFEDVYTIDLRSGKKEKSLTKIRWYNGASADGNHFLYYDDGHYFAYDMVAGNSINLTGKIAGVSFVDTDDDHNVSKPPTRPVGWAKDGKHVLLSDGWDIWKVSADGTGGENLTVNGKADGVRHQGFTQFDPDRTEPGFDLAQTAYTRRYGEWTKKSCLATNRSGQAGSHGARDGRLPNSAASQGPRCRPVRGDERNDSGVRRLLSGRWLIQVAQEGDGRESAAS